MLDDPEVIRRIDSSGMLDTVERMPDQMEDALGLMEGIEGKEGISNVIISGMGGSAISGDMVQAWLKGSTQIPIYVNRDYDIPAWIGEKTLAIFISYSGNTEETLSAFEKAMSKKSICVGISSGGILEEKCKERGCIHIKVPRGYQPRAAIAYLLVPTIAILRAFKVITERSFSELKDAIMTLKSMKREIGKIRKEKDNKAKQIAREIHGTFPHIYGWSYLAPVARRWRTQLNENSKIIAREDLIPECNHNDIVGWSANREISKISSCIILRDKNEPEKIKKRIEFMKEIFKEGGAKVIEVEAIGRRKLSKMLSLLYMGDLVSCYLAIIRGIDPTPVTVISRLKEELSMVK